MTTHNIVTRIVSIDAVSHLISLVRIGSQAVARDDIMRMSAFGGEADIIRSEEPIDYKV